MAHQSTKKIPRVKTTQGRIYVQATSISMLMINKEEVPQQHMPYCNFPPVILTKHVNKEDVLRQHISIMAFSELSSLSIPAESADEGS